MIDKAENTSPDFYYKSRKAAKNPRLFNRSQLEKYTRTNPENFARFLHKDDLHLILAIDKEIAFGAYRENVETQKFTFFRVAVQTELVTMCFSPKIVGYVKIKGKKLEIEDFSEE